MDRILRGSIARTLPLFLFLILLPIPFRHFHPLPFFSNPVQGTFSPTIFSLNPSLDMVSCLANANNFHSSLTHQKLTDKICGINKISFLLKCTLLIKKRIGTYQNNINIYTYRHILVTQEYIKID